MPNPEIGNALDVGGIKTNLHMFGEDSPVPPVLLLHGSGPGVSAWANWRMNLEALSRTRRVVAPDLLGFGYTDPSPDGQYDLQKWRNHLSGLLAALNLQRVDLVGNSFGGALALSFAAHHPEKVRRLVLMGSAGVEFPLTEGLDAVWGYEPSPENMLRLMNIFAFNKELVNEDLAELRYQASIRPGIHEAYSQMFPAPRQQGIEKIATPEDKIRDIAVKTLIIHGRDDLVVPLASSLKLLDLIDRSEMHVFGRCGHWTQIEYAEQFNALVEKFLEKQPSGD